MRSTVLMKAASKMQPYNFEGSAHVIQQALAPVFMLSGIAALLSVFSTRLARTADQARVLLTTQRSPELHENVKLVRRRLGALECAVLLAASTGAFTCATVLVLFLGEVGSSSGATILVLAFGGAIFLTMGALTAFVTEMLFAARGVRITVSRCKNASTADSSQFTQLHFRPTGKVLPDVS